jgi:hypothetical protein
MKHEQRGRPRGSLSGKYKDYSGENLGVYEARKKEIFFKHFFRNAEIKIHYGKRGRPKIPTGKYRDAKGKFIYVYEWRKKNKEWKKEYNLKTRIYRVIRQIKKDALKYNQSFEFIKKLKSKCSICGFDKFPCDIHHKDKDNKNNNKKNLIGLCSRCHLGIHRGYIFLSSDGKYYYNSQNKRIMEILSYF